MKINNNNNNKMMMMMMIIIINVIVIVAITRLMGAFLPLVSKQFKAPQG